MKRIIWGLLLVSLSVVSYAQQGVQYSQSVFNKAYFNPGYAGGSPDGMFYAMAIYRNQLSGFEDAPKATAININGPIDFFNFKSGVSLSIYNNTTGILKSPGFDLGYAYRAEVGGGYLGAGLSAGMVSSTTDPKDWRYPDGSGFDPAIPTEKQTAFAFDLGAGVHYRYQNASVGLSCTHINQPKMTKVDKNSTYKRTFYFTGEYAFKLVDDVLEAHPSLFVASDFSTTLSMLTAGVWYQKKYWFSLGYRSSKAIVGTIMLDIFQGLRLGYSYDYFMSDMSKLGNGSHELSVSYRFMVRTERSKLNYKSIRYL